MQRIRKIGNSPRRTSQTRRSSMRKRNRHKFKALSARVLGDRSRLRWMRKEEMREKKRLEEMDMELHQQIKEIARMERPLVRLQVDQKEPRLLL